ncbi:hypothetical protein [Mycobacterium antarcticum]|nr:hypothetical protein [Mycolicibacterium sp. TUM20983]
MRRAFVALVALVTFMISTGCGSGAGGGITTTTEQMPTTTTTSAS